MAVQCKTRFLFGEKRQQLPSIVTVGLKEVADNLGTMLIGAVR